MASLGRRRTHAVFGDSRVSESLYTEIQKINTKRTPVHVEQYKGAGLLEVVEKADSFLRAYPFDVVYIIAGVNDITNKNRTTGHITFLWKTEDALANYLIATRQNSFEQLSRGHPGAKIIFCPLVGLDLHRVVQGSTVTQQLVVDNAVWRTNISLNKMRNEHSFCFPFLASPVHRIENGKHKSYYHHLAVDGLHLPGKLDRLWAKQLVKAFERN